MLLNCPEEVRETVLFGTHHRGVGAFLAKNHYITFPANLYNHFGGLKNTSAAFFKRTKPVFLLTRMYFGFTSVKRLKLKLINQCIKDHVVFFFLGEMR